MRGGGKCFYDEERRENGVNIAAFCVRNRNEYINTISIGTLSYYILFSFKSLGVTSCFHVPSLLDRV